MSVLARACCCDARRPTTSDDRCIEPDATARPRPACSPIEAVSYPRPWSQGVFESEIEQVRAGAGTTSSLAGVARSGYAGLWFSRRRGARHQHRGRRRTADVGGVATRLLLALADEAIDASVHRVDARGAGVEHRRPGAVPPVRVRPGRDPQALLREHRGCDRDVVPRHPDRASTRERLARDRRRSDAGTRRRDRAASTTRRSCSASRPAATRPRRRW